MFAFIFAFVNFHELEFPQYKVTFSNESAINPNIQAPDGTFFDCETINHKETITNASFEVKNIIPILKKYTGKCIESFFLNKITYCHGKHVKLFKKYIGIGIDEYEDSVDMGKRAVVLRYLPLVCALKTRYTVNSILSCGNKYKIFKIQNPTKCTFLIHVHVPELCIEDFNTTIYKPREIKCKGKLNLFH